MRCLALSLAIRELFLLRVNSRQAGSAKPRSDVPRDTVDLAALREIDHKFVVWWARFYG
jgi:hypothetical protein